jgi:hypothetical protein
MTGVAMAFGPGLVVEMSKLTYVPSPAATQTATQPQRTHVHRLPEHAHAAD